MLPVGFCRKTIVTDNNDALTTAASYKLFDHKLHIAVCVQPTRECGEGRVVWEVQREALALFKRHKKQGNFNSVMTNIAQ